MQQVMVVVPVDADVSEAEHVTQEHRQERPNRVQRVAVRRPEFQHHDRDDDGDDAIAERLETAFGHAPIVTGRSHSRRPPRIAHRLSLARTPGGSGSSFFVCPPPRTTSSTCNPALNSATTLWT